MSSNLTSPTILKSEQPTMKRDDAKLLCDIGELSGLFSDASTLETFLQRIVEMISTHMHSEVCSIYLYYEKDRELVLKATKGLNPKAIGNVRLKLGEGLTGLAVKELRPICEKNASKNPHYRYFPDIGEEAYESFLAVPIVRGQNRIGAVVIQNSRKNYFLEDDVKIFRAVTSQLANTIETAKLLMGLTEGHRHQKSIVSAEELKFIKGKVGAGGFAFAEAVVLDEDESFFDFDKEKLAKQYSKEEFAHAVQVTEKQLEVLQKEIEEKLFDVASLIFTAQILMLKDKSFIDAIGSQIAQGINPPEAIINTVRNYVELFDRLPNAYLREKKQDVKDIGRRLLENLIGIPQSKGEHGNRIVIARELLPSDVLKLSSQSVQGIILLSGGITSHVAILARSLEMPLVITENRDLLHVPPLAKVFLDAEQGNIYVHPSAEIIESFKKMQSDRLNAQRYKNLMKDITSTKDGTVVAVMSNINLLCDLQVAQEMKSEGIGLYRTEFPFLVRADFPTEEEQFVIYKKLVEGMPGKEITFRTLDIGGDKVLSYYDHEREENPFLGMRSIRFSLKHKDIFHQQLRAILRAGAKADIRIMFPMISSVDEFLEARQEVRSCIKNLKKEKVPCCTDPSIGMMVELPSVLGIIDELASLVDFMSVGTNDFIQYMLAVDRTNEKVADLFRPYHPSVLRAFKQIVDAACAQGKEVSICGDMAQDTRYIPYFLGIGIRKFSLDSHYIPLVRLAIAGVSISEAKSMAGRLLKQNRCAEITRVIEGAPQSL